MMLFPRYYGMDKGKLDILCEGLGPTDTWLKCCGTVGKLDGKRRKRSRNSRQGCES